MSELLLEPLRFIVLAGLLLFVARAMQLMHADLRAALPLDSPAPRPFDQAHGGDRAQNKVASSVEPARSWLSATESSASRGEPQLIVEEGTTEIPLGQTFPVEGEIIIGRSPAAHLVLPDRYVSMRHARVAAQDGAVWVSDLGSSNGTFVNDQPVTEPVALADGDRLRIGRIVLRLQWPST